ncbi:MAG: hypothetical protein NTZ97_00335 [Candidatus Moranbacteria bacterium]|nr:hypothetical protein [Candidatus Moranbacteria bacterium]
MTDYLITYTLIDVNQIKKEKFLENLENLSAKPDGFILQTEKSLGSKLMYEITAGSQEEAENRAIQIEKKIEPIILKYGAKICYHRADTFSI